MFAKPLESLEVIKKLELFCCEWGSGSETYDFDCVCVADDKPVWGGRFSYWVLSPFALTRRHVNYGHGYDERNKMYQDLARLSRNK